jgi:uncharacterized phage protein gp47/JayE
MRDFFVANQTKITDLNPGSALDTQFKAMSIQLNQAQVKASGGFKTQFEQIPFQAFNYERKTELFSSGTAVFSRAVADPTEVTIPIGTIIGTSSGLLYTTQNEVVILAGNTDSAVANIIANKAGAEYDVQIGLINVLNSSVPGVNSVTNNTATSGGRNRETNSEYFARFQNFILGLDGANRYGIFTAAVTVDNIRSAFVQDHFPPESGIYNFTVYVDDGSGSVPQSKLDEIYLKIYGNDTSELQGYAAAGINFRVLSAGLVNVAVAYTVKIDLNSTDATAITATLNNTITNYINSLWVGSDVLISEVNRLIKGTSGVLNVEALTLNGLEDDVTTLASQVPRISTITPTVTT